MNRTLPLPFALLLLACGSGVVTAPPKPAAPAGGLGKMVIAAESLPIGEHLRARAEVLGLNVGRLDVTVAKPCNPELANHLTIEAKLSTAGMLRFFNKTSGVSATEVDPTSYRTLRSMTHVDDGDEWREYRLRFKDGAYSYTYTKSSGDTKHETKPVPEGEPVYDSQSAIALLRSWRPEAQGETSYFYVVIGRQLWRADVTYRGPKTIEVENKNKKTLHFDGTAHRVDLKPKEEYTPRHFAVWLENNVSRLPVQVTGDGSVGAVTFYLQGHDMDAPCVAPTPEEIAKAEKQKAKLLEAEQQKAKLLEAEQAKLQAKAKKKKSRRKHKSEPLPVTNEPVWTQDPTGTGTPIL